jgi:gas vesicle protein
MNVMAKNIIPVNNHGLSTMCSQCSSMAHFACINHCNVVFCGKCSVKHRTEVIKQMDDLTQQLQRCKIEPVSTHDEIDNNFLRASQQTIQRTRDTVNNLIAEIQQREDTIIKEIENGLEMRRKEREKRTQ